jgi:predicted HTH domain antitoxin
MNLTIPYPDSLPDALRLSRAEFEQEARMAMAVALFAKGRITSGQAAALAGCERVDFLRQTAALRIEAAMPDPDELAADDKALTTDG